MEKVYIIQDHDQILDQQHDIYDEMTLLLKHRHPDAEFLGEDDELFKLHDLLLLLRAKQLDVARTEDRVLILKINES